MGLPTFLFGFRVKQPREYLALCSQTVVVRDVTRNLEHVLFVAAVLADQQRVAG